MTTQAARLVVGAKEWASQYGDYANGNEGAVLTAPLRVRAAWAANDADALADMFIENGSMLLGDNQLDGREAIRSYLKDAFAGTYQGSRLVEEPCDIRLLTEAAALAVMQGGVLRAGEETLEPAAHARSTWVVVKRDGDWRVASYQSSPVTG